MTAAYNFKEFNALTGRFTPLVSVMRTGVIGLSAGFTKTYEIDQQKYSSVKLYFDIEKKAVGMRFFAGKEEGALPLRFIPRGGAQINAASFWYKFQVAHKNIQKFIPEIVEQPEGKIYVFELDKPTRSGDVI
jgi:hypothetical protein